MEIPFVIRFTDGYYAVKSCINDEHALRRAAEEHPGKTVGTIIDLDKHPHGWYR